MLPDKLPPLDLSNIPFGRKGSRIMVILENEKLWIALEAGARGAFLSGMSIRNRGILEITLYREGKELSYSYECDGFTLRVFAPGAEFEMAIGEASDMLLIKGTGAELKLDSYIAGGISRNMGSAADITSGGGRFVLLPIIGAFSFDDSWSLRDFGSVRAEFSVVPENEALELAVFAPGSDSKLPEAAGAVSDFAADAKLSYSGFLEKIADVPDEYSEQRKLSAYLIWSSHKTVSDVSDAVITHRLDSPVTKGGEAALISMAFKDAEAAARLLLSVNECYPPILGIAALRITDSLPRYLVLPLHSRLKETADWWLENRFRNGKFYYRHRYETGEKNPTAFLVDSPVESPDLYECVHYLFLALSRLDAAMSNNYAEKTWLDRAIQAKAGLEALSTDRGYFARSMITGKTAATNKTLDDTEWLFIWKAGEKEEEKE